MDDDADSRVDEGCPCGPGETQACFPGPVRSRSLGACSDGVQRCRATPSVEWGDWGEAPCEGAVLPAAEMCDGGDHDCDGARDEDCPCTAGETRECGLEFLMAPCRGGTQTCSASGVWSDCEGAIGPSADVCDGVDNDCDGRTDPGCGCVPMPERCRDGVDNDCDGEVDEPACTPDWPGDAGVPDGGRPDASTPVGQLLDCPTASLRWDRLSRPATETSPALSGFNSSRVVWTGAEFVFLYQGGVERTSNPDMYLARYDASGAHVSTTRVPIDLSGLFQTVYGLVWTGSHLVVAYWQGAMAFLQRVALDASLIGAPVGVPGSSPVLAWNGTELAVAWLDAREGGVRRGIYFRAYDASLSPIGAEVLVQAPVVEGGMNAVSLAPSGQPLAWTGSRWVLAWAVGATAPVTSLGVLDGASLESTRIITRSGGASDMHATPTLAAGGGGGALCWQHVFGMWDFAMLCERFDATGARRGAPVTLVPRLMTMGGFVGLSRLEGGYALVFVSTTAGQSDSYVWRDGSDMPEVLARPSDMDRSSWGFAYWESDFGELQSAPHALVVQSRGDRFTGSPTRTGNVEGRARLRCVR